MQKTDLNIKSSYKSYKSTAKNVVEEKQFITIANGYMQFLIDKVLAGEEVTLPARMGTFFIQGTKKPLRFSSKGIPMLPPNWAKTKELWDRNPEAKETRKMVYCLNEETDGIVYKLCWSKNRVPIENKLYYNFILTRANKRAIHAMIKQGKEYLIKN
jgi:hypothetical protein